MTPDPNDKSLQIEARLERSLRSQVKAPRLGKQFDASVWSRIEAENVTAPVPARAGSQWLFVINGIGIGVAGVMLLAFGGQWFFAHDANVELPRLAVPAATIADFVKHSGQLISIVAVAFGLMFTPLGRRVRAELRELF
jgi:hypothetical protein